jgi:hypothetical protein
MRVRSRLRVSVSRSIWSFWTPSMNSSRESSPGVERRIQRRGCLPLQSPELDSYKGPRQRKQCGKWPQKAGRRIQSPKCGPGTPRSQCYSWGRGAGGGDQQRAFVPLPLA